jgi:putative transposase
MHRTLKLETASPAQSTMDAQQAAFDCFRYTYNHERPHEALDQRTPASLYTPSPRPMPSSVGEPEYPEDFELRRVNPNGNVKFNANDLGLSALLVGETIGLEEVDAGWQLWFGPIYLGLAARHGKKNELVLIKNLPVTQTMTSA